VTVRLALLDRDGTINRKAPEGEYVTHPSQLEVLPGAAAAIRALNDAGVPVAVVTNQRCLALGRLDAAGLEGVHQRLSELLAEQAGAHVDAILHCPHERGTCGCRKPAPGLLHEAARRFGVVPSDAVMIGDALSDVEAGERFGAQTIHLTGGASPATATAPDLATAVRALLARERTRRFARTPAGLTPALAAAAGAGPAVSAHRADGARSSAPHAAGGPCGPAAGSRERAAVASWSRA